VRYSNVLSTGIIYNNDLIYNKYNIDIDISEENLDDGLVILTDNLENKILSKICNLPLRRGDVIALNNVTDEYYDNGIFIYNGSTIEGPGDNDNGNILYNFPVLDLNDGNRPINYWKGLVDKCDNLCIVNNSIYTSELKYNIRYDNKLKLDNNEPILYSWFINNNEKYYIVYKVKNIYNKGLWYWMKQFRKLLHRSSYLYVVVASQMQYPNILDSKILFLDNTM
jgi:hypothetical protein